MEKGADVTATARSGQTTVDMSDGSVQRIHPIVETSGAAGEAGGHFDRLTGRIQPENR